MFDLMKAMKIAGSGMNAQSFRLRIVGGEAFQTVGELPFDLADHAISDADLRLESTDSTPALPIPGFPDSI